MSPLFNYYFPLVGPDLALKPKVLSFGYWRFSSCRHLSIALRYQSFETTFSFQVLLIELKPIGFFITKQSYYRY